MNSTLQAALNFYDAGCSVIPARVDGTKAPIGNWKQYQIERPSREQIVEWFQDGHAGMGVVTGKVSGNLELVEFEGRAVKDGLLDEAREIAINSGMGDLWNLVTSGYVEFTPSGGIHILYRIADEDVPGNSKFARRPGEGDTVEVLIESRGEGGFVITAPSHGATHPTGQPWVLVKGSPSSIPMLSWEERNDLILILRMLDQMPVKEQVVAQLSSAPSTGTKPGDIYNQQANWDEILIPRGWKISYTQGNTTYWTRPGKDFGVSATTKADTGNLYVFTTSTTFEADKPYSKFAAYTHLDHAGDYSKAASALRFLGYKSAIDTSNSLPSFGQEIENGVKDERSPEEREFDTELNRTRMRREVKRVLDAEEATKHYDRFSFVANLQDELKLPEEEISWTIENLMPTGSNVTLTAQYKAGKTTLINNLAKSLSDGTSFLNYFKPAKHLGRIVIFNYEVSENQYRRWMKDIAIENSGKVTLVHLRGKAVPMISDYVRKEVIETLQSLNCQTWIVDPFARAFTGSGDENSNSDVGVFLDQLDIIKERAGVSNMILPVHTGRAQEFGIDRARGATRIDDWADVRWLLKKTEDGRFFSADGRDVMLEEQMLRFDVNTRHLTLGGSDSRTAKKQNLEDMWVEVVKKNPGLNTGALCQLLNKGTDDKGLASARKSAVYFKRVKSNGVGSATLWWPFDHILPWQQQMDVG